jgi:hypothetical protein
MSEILSDDERQIIRMFLEQGLKLEGFKRLSERVLIKGNNIIKQVTEDLELLKKFHSKIKEE